jgi:hypothetical protein
MTPKAGEQQQCAALHDTSSSERVKGLLKRGKIKVTFSCASIIVMP